MRYRVVARLVSAVVLANATAVAGYAQVSGATVGAATDAAATAKQGTPNMLTTAERTAGWRLLFDGTTTKGWRGYKSEAVPNGWRAANGTLTKDASVGDILTADQFGNFELALDWKIVKGGNAGVFYRGTQEYDHIYWSAPEYQLLDDANAPDGKSRLTSAAAAYAL